MPTIVSGRLAETGQGRPSAHRRASRSSDLALSSETIIDDGRQVGVRAAGEVEVEHLADRRRIDERDGATLAVDLRELHADAGSCGDLGHVR